MRTLLVGPVALARTPAWRRRRRPARGAASRVRRVMRAVIGSPPDVCRKAIKQGRAVPPSLRLILRSRASGVSKDGRRSGAGRAVTSLISNSIKNGPGRLNDCAIRSAQPSSVSACAASTPRPSASCTQPMIGIAEIEHVHRGPARIGADSEASSPIRIWYLRFDRITVVTGSFSRACVHSPAPCTSPSRRPAAPARGGRRRRVARSADGAPDRQRNAGADRAAHDLQPVVRRGRVRVAEEAAAVAHRLVDDHRAFRQHRGDGGGEILRRRLALDDRTASARCRECPRPARRVRRPAPAARASASCSNAAQHVQLGAVLPVAARLARDRRRSRPAARR